MFCGKCGIEFEGTFCPACGNKCVTIDTNGAEDKNNKVPWYLSIPFIFVYCSNNIDCYKFSYLSQNFCCLLLGWCRKRNIKRNCRMLYFSSNRNCGVKNVRRSYYSNSICNCLYYNVSNQMVYNGQKREEYKKQETDNLKNQAMNVLKLLKERENPELDDLIVKTKTGRANTATNLEHRMHTIFKNAGLDDSISGLHW